MEEQPVQTQEEKELLLRTARKNIARLEEENETLQYNQTLTVLELEKGLELHYKEQEKQLRTRLENLKERIQINEQAISEAKQKLEETT